MISALPLVLARRAAQAVDAVAGPMGLFSAPCVPAVGAPSGTLPGSAAVHVTLTALAPDDAIGARSAGEILSTRFDAEVTLHLLGPGTLDMADATLTPTDVAADGRDLMLSVVLDRLSASNETGGAADDRADVLAGDRRLAAEWRFDRMDGVTPMAFGDRSAWALTAHFRGIQTLSPVPAEGGRILQLDIEEDVLPEMRRLEVHISATSDDLPLSILAGVGAEHATRLAASGLETFADLTRVPATSIDAVAAEIAPEADPLNASLRLLNMLLGMRRTLVLAGLSAGLLDAPLAEKPLADVWDGTTLTLPSGTPSDQVARIEIMARPIVPFIRSDAWPRVTLGQLSTARAEVR